MREQKVYSTLVFYQVHFVQNFRTFFLIIVQKMPCSGLNKVFRGAETSGENYWVGTSYETAARVPLLVTSRKVCLLLDCYVIIYIFYISALASEVHSGLEVTTTGRQESASLWKEPQQTRVGCYNIYHPGTGALGNIP